MSKQHYSLKSSAVTQAQEGPVQNICTHADFSEDICYLTTFQNLPSLNAETYLGMISPETYCSFLADGFCFLCSKIF